MFVPASWIFESLSFKALLLFLPMEKKTFRNTKKNRGHYMTPGPKLHALFKRWQIIQN